MIGISDTARTKVRQRAVLKLRDSVTVRRSAPAAMDPTTKIIAVTAGTVVYTGDAKVGVVSPSGTVSVGEGEVPVDQVTITLPWTATGVRNDDLVTVDACAADDEMLGTVWRVIGVGGGGGFNQDQQLTCTTTVKSRHWTGGS